MTQNTKDHLGAHCHKPCLAYGKAIEATIGIYTLLAAATQ